MVEAVCSTATPLATPDGQTSRTSTEREPNIPKPKPFTQAAYSLGFTCLGAQAPHDSAASASSARGLQRARGVSRTVGLEHNLHSWRVKEVGYNGAVDDLESIGAELPVVARRAIALHLSRGRPEAGESKSAVPRLPVFVTLRERGGSLRGCIGSLTAVESDVVRETARSAVLAATRDPRFPPVSERELGSLRIEVSVLMPDEAVSGLEQLDPSRYGVIVRDLSGRRGLLLPEVPGVHDASAQVAVARRKAGIPANAVVELRRFEVRKFSDNGGGDPPR
ncbi:MAG TPA: AmmeMemoRadiSam system protein A [Polyangiaceae bacterium]|nr:AmmeMemoRadiSam system protein A [Polyangiaceae bacterium]